MRDREEFEKAYTHAFIGEELKGLESIIFARFEIGGEYAQDKVATAYAMWQSRVPDGYVVVPKEPSAKTLEAGSNASGDGKMGFATHMDVNNSYKAMIESE